MTPITCVTNLFFGLSHIVTAIGFIYLQIRRVNDQTAKLLISSRSIHAMHAHQKRFIEIIPMNTQTNVFRR